MTITASCFSNKTFDPEREKLTRGREGANQVKREEKGDDRRKRDGKLNAMTENTLVKDTSAQTHTGHTALWMRALESESLAQKSHIQKQKRLFKSGVQKHKKVNFSFSGCWVCTRVCVCYTLGRECVSFCNTSCNKQKLLPITTSLKSTEELTAGFFSSSSFRVIEIQEAVTELLNQWMDSDEFHINYQRGPGRAVWGGFSSVG